MCLGSSPTSSPKVRSRWIGVPIVHSVLLPHMRLQLHVQSTPLVVFMENASTPAQRGINRGSAEAGQVAQHARGP